MKHHLRFWVLALVLSVGWTLGFPGSRQGLAFRSERPRSQINCNATLNELTASPDWYDQLLDPVITSQEALLERLALYVEAHQCLIEGSEPTSAELIRAIPYLEYFRIFALGYGTPEGMTKLNLVDLRSSDDPAIRQLRESGGLAAPEGYIFVRTYRSRQAMPAHVQQLFAEDTAGVTLLTRYIAILEDDPISWEEQAMQAQRLPKTISHELVHAFVNASVGLDGLEQLPRWYSEGVAIYLSNSGEDHVVVGPDFKITSTSPQDYKDFRDFFKYLEAKLGKERLLKVIGESIIEVDPSRVYRDLAYENDAAFIQAAQNYWQRRFYLVSGLIIAGLLLGVWWLFRLMPDIRCRHCLYAGKRAEFTGGICPNCRRPYNR